MSDPDTEWMFTDSSYVKAHQHSAGAAGDEPQAIGKSRAGNTSKTYPAVDAYGLPIRFRITRGEVNDCTTAPELIAYLPDGQIVVGDKGYDSKALRQQIADRGMTSVIPRKKNSKRGNEELDWHLYKYRHLVENAFCRPKQHRGLAIRYDKLGRNYESVVAIMCAFLWLPM